MVLLYRTKSHSWRQVRVKHRREPRDRAKKSGSQSRLGYGQGMRIEPRVRLARLLGALDDSSRFSVQRTAVADDLAVEIVGLGPLELPVSAAQVKELRSIARPARYGLGEQTLTDPRVRDTWELPKSRVRIDGRRWNKTLTPVLDELRLELGLPDGCRLRAQLHSVLMYEPGQFFAPHKDSEKTDTMVGTLVVTLPSTARGGELVVRHGGSREKYRASGRLLSFVAFYADCEHEVRPLTSGCRVALTYNLSVEGTSDFESVDDHAVAEISDCLDTHFETEDRLIYLLDHEYTQRGLSFRRLKGADVRRVAALRAAARDRDDRIALALADIHETWSCEESYDDWYDGDDGDQVVAGSSDLGELLDGGTALAAAIDSSGVPAQLGSEVAVDEEICATTPNGQLEPYDSDYEGYMGNYGNTMDRWYRRGAVVMWPGSRDFTVRAQGAPRWALETLSELLREGDIAGARERAGTLASFWDRVTISSPDNDEQDGAELGLTLDVALALDDAALAAMLLTPFGLLGISPRQAPAVAAVADRYGDKWFRALLVTWETAYGGWSYGERRTTWSTELPSLCREFAQHDDRIVAKAILGISVGGFLDALQRAAASMPPSQRVRALGELVGPAAGFLLGAAAVADIATSEKLCTALGAGDETLRCTTATLRRVAETSPELLTASPIDVLVEITRERLLARLARPAREPDDWSIRSPDTCACELCDKLRSFLEDPASRHLDWPLAEQGRRHVQDRIDRHELPVRHDVRKKGRPYTLVLTKTSALLDQEKRERDTDLADLSWLETRTR